MSGDFIQTLTHAVERDIDLLLVKELYFRSTSRIGSRHQLEFEARSWRLARLSLGLRGDLS